MQGLVHRPRIKDDELRQMNSALNSLVLKLFLIIRKYMKPNVSRLERIFELSLRKYSANSEEALYSIAIKVCEEHFMRDYIEEVFKMNSSQIKAKCHMHDNCGKGWYLIDIRFGIPSLISDKWDSTLKQNKFLLDNLIPIVSMLQVHKAVFWLPSSWENILIADPFDDGLNFSYSFDWRTIFLSDVLEDTSTQEYVKAKLMRVNKAYHLLDIYVKIFEEHMKEAFPKESYDLSYEATRL